MNRSDTEGRIDVPGGGVFWRGFGSGGGIPLLMIHGGPGLASSYLDGFTALSATRPSYVGPARLWSIGSH